MRMTKMRLRSVLLTIALSLSTFFPLFHYVAFADVDASGNVVDGDYVEHYEDSNYNGSNSGTIGTVEQNAYLGNNSGKVEINKGTVWDNIGGTVQLNEGYIYI